MPTSLIDTPGTLRPMLRLALPVLAEQLLLMLVGISDTLLAGRYFEEPHLAAMNLLVYGLWFLTSLFSVIWLGANALIARHVGARESRAARRVLNQALLVGALMSAAATVVGMLLARRIVLLLQLDGEAAELAARYLMYLMPVLPAIMVQTIGVAALRAAGDMVTGLVVSSVVNVVNIVLSWSLVRGWGPFDSWGWDGLAAGTACGFVCGGTIVAVLLAVGRAGLRWDRHLMRPDVAVIRRILRIGVPGGSDLLLIIACHFWFVSIINRLGVEAAAAHGIAVRIESLAYLPGTAFQWAAATLAGQYLGAKQYHKAAHSVLLACLVGGGVMTAAGVLFFTLPEAMTGIFLADERSPVAAAAVPLLRIVAFAMPPLALTMILSGALRGAGDTRWPLAISMIGFVGIRIPGAYLLTMYWGWGLKGAWYAMVFDLLVRCGLIVYRFQHGGWKRVEV